MRTTIEDSGYLRWGGRARGSGGPDQAGQVECLKLGGNYMVVSSIILNLYLHHIPVLDLQTWVKMLHQAGL